MLKFLKIYLLFFICAITQISNAQSPSNDHCTSASIISIPSGGFSTGLFHSLKINLTNADKESGESFDSIIKQTGLNRKTVWYKFSISTTRNVSVELKQKDTMIAQNAVGFTIYETKNCPTNDGEISTYLTTIPKFGKSANSCLPSGDYLIQVCANFKANDTIWIDLNINYPGPANYDNPATAYDFGLAQNSKSVIVNPGCLSIMDSTEIFPSIGSNYKDFSQTAWFTFTTDNYSDMLLFSLNYTGNDTIKVPFRIYEGDAKNNYSGLKNFDSAVFSNYYTQYYYKYYLCQAFKPNTKYSVQLFFYKSAYFQTTFYLQEQGNDTTQSANPLNLPAKYQMGTIAFGQTKSDTDQFACNAMTKYYPYGNIITPIITDTNSYNGNTYDMNTWVTFRIAQRGKVSTAVYTYNCKNNGSYGAFLRLFKGDITKSNNLNLVSYYGIARCLDSGVYSLQVLINSVNSKYISVCDDVGLGKKIVVRISLAQPIIQPIAIHGTAATAENMGDVVPYTNTSWVNSSTDYLGGPSDTVTIDSIQLHNHFIYRQFYLSAPRVILINPSISYLHYFFKGKATNGLSTLKFLDSSYGNYTKYFGRYYSAADGYGCLLADTGWYTVVSTEDLNLSCETVLNQYPESIQILASLPCVTSFNKPYKASAINNGNPLQKGNQYNIAYECFSCVPDTPLFLQTISKCNSQSQFLQKNRVAYYVFRLTQESRVDLSYNTSALLYNFDVRTDSLLLIDTTRIITPCSGNNEFCRLQPGTYTLVFLSNIHTTFSTTIYVNSVLISAFDHAINSYDFGYVPPTNTTLYSVKDTISCTTGAEPKDPSSYLYGGNYYPDNSKSSVPYPMPTNYSTDVTLRRNLWYTFTASGTGSITVSALISDQSIILPFHIYKSNKNGAIPFNVLRTTGNVDSTLNQGLTFIQNNYNGNNLTSTISFNKSGCDSSRYYVLVETLDYGNQALYRNYPVVVSVSYNGINYATVGDYCTNAIPMSISGVGTTSATALVNCHTIGESFGEDGSNMGCLFDNKNYKSSWFKLTMNSTQKVDLTFSLQNNTTASPQNIRYRVLYGDCNAMTPGPCVENGLSSFRLDCMASGDYYIQVVTPNNTTGNITVSASTTISVYPICKPFSLFVPIANFAARRNCNDTLITFQNLSSSGNDITYKWDFGNGITSNNKVPTTSYLHKHSIDTFFVKLIVYDTVHHSSDSLQLPFYIFNYPLYVDAGKDELISCKGSVQLYATTNYPNPVFEWNPPNYLSNIYIPNPIASPVYAIKYQVTLTGDDDCFLQDSMNIFYSNSIKILGDGILCIGTKKVLSGPAGYTNYHWSTNQTTQTIQIDTAGIYILYVSGGACTGYDTIKVSMYNQPKLNLVNDTSICNGNNLVLNAKDSAYNNYLWNTGATTPQIKVTQPGKYIVTASNSNCSIKDSTTLKLFSLPHLHLPSDTIVCLSQLGAVILDAGKFKSYYWYPTGEHTQTIAAVNAEIYIVVVTDSNNCIGSDSTLIDDNCPYQLYMPNAFTPTNDLLNETFRGYGLGIAQFEMHIYNCWGEELFSTTDINKGWDGTFKNNPCMADVYVWQVIYRLKNETNLRTDKGTVMLLK